MKSSVVTLGVRNRNALYLSLYNVARLPIMELPAATGAITAEPASLETNVKLFAFRVPFETARTPVMVILLDNKLVPECATFKSFNIGRASPE
jgi:hypothetical protein